jgi:Tol biopolymer transport system component
VAVVLGGLALWQLVDDGQAPPVTPEEASAGADAPTLAFSSGSRIFLAGEDGRPQPLPGQGLRKEPDWSPDGTRLAYSQGGDIWTSDLEGGDTVQVTNGPDEDGSPAWSPDGATLAFGRKAGEAPSEIWVVDSGGGEPARVAAGGAPDWSHDGRRLVYQRDFQIWIAAADGTDERSLTADYGGPALFPAWSPDGTRIAFILPDPQPSGCTIVVVKPNGNERQDKDLARPLRCRDVSWSPDGKRLVFAGGDEGIFSVPRLGTDAEQIVDAPGAQNPSWSPTS